MVEVEAEEEFNTAPVFLSQPKLTQLPWEMVAGVEMEQVTHGLKDQTEQIQFSAP